MRPIEYIKMDEVKGSLGVHCHFNSMINCEILYNEQRTTCYVVQNGGIQIAISPKDKPNTSYYCQLKQAFGNHLFLNE